MILMDELKPIIEPLVSDDNAAEIISAIQAIDTHTAESEVEAAVAAANAEWGRKFKETFFGGAAHSEPDPDPEPEPEPDAEDVSLDDLIYPDGK